MQSRLLLSLVLLLTALMLTAQSSSLNLKVYLEGPYNASSEMMDTKLYDLGYLPGMKAKTFLATAVSSEDPYNPPTLKKSNTLDVSLYSQRSVDWILVSIVDDSGNTTWKGTLLLEANGHVVTDNIDDLTLDQEKKYKLVISHRNHLPVQSPLVSVADGALSFDFTTADISGLKSIGDDYVLRGGALRISSDGSYIIEMSDIEEWKNSIGLNSSYLLADIDMDGDVSVHDKSIILSNLDASSTLK